MKKLLSLIILSSFTLVSSSYAQNYGSYDQSKYNDPYNSPQGYPSQSYQTPNQQGAYGANYQNQMSSRNAYQNDSQKTNNQSGWWSSNDDSSQNVPDDVISSNVMQNLRSTPYFSMGARNLQVTTKDGKVTLNGTVANKNEKNQIEYMVKNVQGVKSVSNNMNTEK